MIKKVSTTLIIFILFLLSSCNNLIEGNYGRNELSFGVGDTIAESISKAVTANEQIKDTTDFLIECELLRGDKVIKQESKTAQLSNLHETTFDLNDIPNGNNYFISLKISYGNYLLYTAKSDVIILNENAEEAVVNLQLVQNNSIISYNLDDGEFIEGTRKPISYFVTSTIKIPEPVKAHYKFDGWYSNSEFTGEKIVELGKNRFLGNVTLYAKWVKLNQVSSVTISPDKEKIDSGDNLTLTTLTEAAVIHYTTDGSEPTVNSAVYNKDLKLEIQEDFIKNDKVTIKAIAIKDGMDNSSVTVKEYTRNRYTVTFDKNGHGIAPKQIPALKKYDKINKPEDLTESGFIFGGWYTTSNCSDNELWDFEKHIVESSDITLYAKWTAIGVKVEPAAGGVEFGDEITMTCWPAGAEIYYTTDGTPATKAGTKYTGTLKVDDVLIAKGDNFTVNAIAVIGNDISPAVSNKYSMNRYTVIYNKNGHGQDTQNGVNLRKDSEIILPDLTQEKMNFKGWILDGKVIKPGKLILTADIISKAVNGIITFNASWEGVVDNVTFSPTASPVDYSDTVTLTCLTPGATIYYTTDGITEPTATAGTRYTDPIPIDNVDGITIKARAVLANWHDSAVTEANYTVKKDYTVTFDANSRGTAPKQITGLKKTDKITEPQPLTAENFIFGGWYKSSNCLDNEKWNFNTNTIETSNITLYAKWTELTVTTEMTATDYDFGDVITLSSNTPGANIYYTVDGTTPTELSTLYKAGELKLADSFTLNAIAVKDGVTSKTLTKQYTMITYEVSFSLNGHGETVPDKIQNLKKKDSLKTKKPADLTAKGYIFGGWYLTQECADSDVWNFDTDTITGNVTLYAKWTPITYTVRFNKNDTAAEGTMGEQTFTYDVPQALTQCGFTKADYNFAGWFPTSACNGEISYADKFEVSNLSTTNGGVVDLYAKWVPKEYTIVFNANSDTGIAGTMSNQTFQYTETKNLTTCGFTKTGYNFVGWNTKPDGKGTDYANNASVTQLGFGTINLYAKWELATYNITYANCDGATNKNALTYNINTPTITLQNPAKEGYTFNQWLLGSASGSPITEITQGSTGNKTLYAKWTNDAPANVTGATATSGTGDFDVNLSWTNPTVADYAKVVISYDDYTADGAKAPKTVTINEPNNTTSITVTTSGKYVFKFTTYDNDNMASADNDVVTKEIVVNPYNLTLEPKVLPSGTNGTKGTKATYIEFGDWPQAYVPESSVNTTGGTIKINNWDCYKGKNDNNYYVKVAQAKIATGTGFSPKFADGTSVQSGKVYYFKLEPIKWVVLTDNYEAPQSISSSTSVATGRKLLLAEKGLDAHNFSSSTCKYNTSDIRDYLNSYNTYANDGFLQKAFAPMSIAKITTTIVDNSQKSTESKSSSSSGNTNYCSNTEDKLFLLSIKEATSASYNFNEWSSEDVNRGRQATDYTKANGVYYYSNGGDGNCYWWLRSIDKNAENATYVNKDGYLTPKTVTSTEQSIIPALTISIP